MKIAIFPKGFLLSVSCNLSSLGAHFIFSPNYRKIRSNIQKADAMGLWPAGLKLVSGDEGPFIHTALFGGPVHLDSSSVRARVSAVTDLSPTPLPHTHPKQNVVFSTQRMCKRWEHYIDDHHLVAPELKLFQWKVSQFWCWWQAVNTTEPPHCSRTFPRQGVRIRCNKFGVCVINLFPLFGGGWIMEWDILPDSSNFAPPQLFCCNEGWRNRIWFFFVWQAWPLE